MSVAGVFGTAIRDFTRDLFASALVHNIASDSHDSKRRAPGFAPAFGRMEDTLDGASEGARWFVEDAARAICESTGWRRIKGSAERLISRRSVSSSS